MFPYEPYLKRGFQALRVGVSNVVRVGIHDAGDIWQPARTDAKGLVRRDEAKGFGGLTLYTSGHGTDAYLVDAAGQVVHEWNVPFATAFPDPEHVSDPIGDRIAYFRRAHAYPNGDLLVIYEGYGDTPWGLGLAKVDRDSKLIWAYPERAHHDFEVAEDGTITTLIHRMRDVVADPLPGGNGALEGTVVEDFVVQLTSDGKEIARVNVLETLAASPWGGLVGHRKFADFESWDPLHSNDVSVVGPAFAAHHDFVRPGQVLMSMRTLDLLAILDLQERQFVWASRGIWEHQHDPDPLENGNILVFDNFGKHTPGGASRVLEVDPVTGATKWKFEGTPKAPFESLTRSSQQVLPNGNLMIVESDGSRILEITRGGDVVWEFVNPRRRNEGNEVPIIADATRYPADYLTFTP